MPCTSRYVYSEVSLSDTQVAEAAKRALLAQYPGTRLSIEGSKASIGTTTGKLTEIEAAFRALYVAYAVAKQLSSKHLQPFFVAIQKSLEGPGTPCVYDVSGAIVAQVTANTIKTSLENYGRLDTDVLRSLGVGKIAISAEGHKAGKAQAHIHA